jgi:hypothetical protein
MHVLEQHFIHKKAITRLFFKVSNIDKIEREVLEKLGVELDLLESENQELVRATSHMMINSKLLEEKDSA